MNVSETPIGRLTARPVRLVLVAAAFAVGSAAVPVPADPAAALAGHPVATEASTPASGALQRAEHVQRARTPEPDGKAADTRSRPHVLDNEVADVLVRVRGSATCTGTPITGTTYVVTAAHCVLDEVGEVSSTSTVLRDGVEYTAVSVLVDTRYHDAPGPRHDAAVLIMDQVIPGPSATLGDLFPAEGLVTLAGLQPLDTDGSLLRGSRPDDRPHPRGATGGVVHIDSAAAGCVHLVSDLEVTSIEVNVPCGLIPGASGGGLYVAVNGELSLVGIISTVAADLSYNGVVTLTALHALLDNRVEFTHEMPVRSSTRNNVGVSDRR